MKNKQLHLTMDAQFLTCSYPIIPYSALVSLADTYAILHLRTTSQLHIIYI